MFRNKRLASVHDFQTILFCVFVDREFHVFGLISFSFVTIIALTTDLVI